MRYEPTSGSVSAQGTEGALGSLTGYCRNSENSAPASETPLERLSGTFELRAKLRPHSADERIAKCGRVVHTDPCIVTEETADGERTARWTGICLCNRAGCPVCGAAKAHRFHDDVLRALSMGGTWQHIILTVPHGPEDPWSSVYERLLDGLRSLSKERTGRLVMAEVKASLRATETTYSVRHGWHVHFHVLWKVRALLPEEQAIVAREWSESTGASVEWGCRFGMTIHADDEAQRRMGAAYVTKIAAEMSGTAKGAHGEHWTLGELFRRAADGEWIDRYQEYQTATKGRRLYQLDRRAAQLRDSAAELPKPTIVNTWVTMIERRDFSKLARAERRDPMAIYLPLEVAARCRGDPSDTVDEHIWYFIEATTGPPTGT